MRKVVLSGSAARGRFPTTRRSLVIHGPGPDAYSREALAFLCSAYWYPLYAYIRRQGENVETAQDLTQGFFARLIENHYWKDFDRERGRFRTFLVAAFRHYVSNERARERAQKRGGDQVLFPFGVDMREAEKRYQMEPSHSLTPEKIYERRWALTLLERSLKRLRSESANPSQFDRLRAFLTGDQEMSYSQLAEQLGRSEGAVKVAVHRLRRRYGELVREEIAQTVSSPEEVKGEMGYLLSAVSV